MSTLQREFKSEKQFQCAAAEGMFACRYLKTVCLSALATVLWNNFSEFRLDVSLLMGKKWSYCNKCSFITAYKTEELYQDLSETNFIIVRGDGPKRKPVKLIPFVIRFIYSMRNIKIKLLGIHSVKIEILRTIVDDIQIQSKNTNLQRKRLVFILWGTPLR
jgi:hypothetical protein